ncbi:MAG: SCP2 domain-containing protein [Mariprofundaceae bacterium]
MSIMFLPLRLIPVAMQCVVLSTVLELFFSRDTKLKPMLEGLDGKVFRIHVTDMGTDFFMGFSHARPWVHPYHEGKADVRIDATTAGFARLCFAREDPDDLVFQQVLKLSGDSEAMLRFKKLLAAADIDYERELRAAFGDYFGSRVAAAAHALLKTEEKLKDRSREAVSGYLHKIDVPTQTRLQAWQAGVEDLSRKISRLKGRVTRLEHQWPKKEDK